MEKLCETCEHREQCQAPCKAVQALLWKDNRVMERVYQDMIVTYPQGHETRFSEAKAPGRIVRDFDIEDIPDTATIPWTSDDFELTQSKVFFERFFNKISCRELAERYGVKENTIVCMYANAVKRIDKILKTLDARKEGVKALKPDRFTEDQKYFLLVSVFGFSGAEVARMFNKNRNRVNMAVKRMADRYQALFEEPDVEKSVYSGLNVEQIKERMAY